MASDAVLARARGRGLAAGVVPAAELVGLLKSLDFIHSFSDRALAGFEFFPPGTRSFDGRGAGIGFACQREIMRLGRARGAQCSTIA